MRRDIVLLAGLVLLAGFLWGRGRHTWYWLDESLAVGIASHPLSEIPELLRHDGAPPLFYVLLHFWMRIFGSGEGQTHALTLIFAVATVPAALWAGWSLFGRRTGWMLAMLAALSPYIATYANETRMYSMVVFLSTLATATFLHGFVFRRRRYIPAFAVLLVVLFYTHNWTLFFGMGAGLGVLVCLALLPDRRKIISDASLAFGAAAVAYLPWLPSLLYQRAHTGAPWSPRPTLLRAQDELALLVGGREAVVAMGLGALPALIAMLRWPWTRRALAVATTALIPTIVVLAGWGTSRAASVWAFRYLAVIVPPILLLTAVGFARGGRAALGALGVLAFLTAPIAVRGPFWQKSNLREITDQTGPVLRPDDLVVADFSELPLLSRHLRSDVRFLSTTGPVEDPGLADQRNLAERFRRNDPRVILPPIIQGLPVGARVLFVCHPHVPISRDMTDFSKLSIQRCDQTKQLLANDSRLRLEAFVEAPRGVTYRPLDGYLFLKHAA